MQIRIGRRKYIGNKFTDPSYPGFKPIIVMTASTKYGDLGPYVLKTEEGYILENVWQFSKLYKEVPDVKIPYSRYDKQIIWSHPSETHYDAENKKIRNSYWKWREKGFKNPFPVRYPVGYKDRHKCLTSLKEIGKDIYIELNYIEARKEIYLPIYINSVQKEEKFRDLEKLLQTENLLIIEVDGPHQESLSYYMEKYGVDETFIERDTILATERNLNILLNDEKHPFGHGYCLAIALLNIPQLNLAELNINL